jgi:hypothetical protein
LPSNKVGKAATRAKVFANVSPAAFVKRLGDELSGRLAAFDWSHGFPSATLAELAFACADTNAGNGSRHIGFRRSPRTDTDANDGAAIHLAPPIQHPPLR